MTGSGPMPQSPSRYPTSDMDVRLWMGREIPRAIGPDAGPSRDPAPGQCRPDWRPPGGLRRRRLARRLLREISQSVRPISTPGSRIRSDARRTRFFRISPASASMMCLCRRRMLARQEPRPATHGLQQASPTGARSKAGLEVMPIDNVTLISAESAVPAGVAPLSPARGEPERGVTRVQ
jgi:hypothetical protein